MWRSLKIIELPGSAVILDKIETPLKEFTGNLSDRIVLSDTDYTIDLLTPEIVYIYYQITIEFSVGK